MSSYPLSTCATDGSNTRRIGSASANDHLVASTSASSSDSITSNSNDATKADEEASRMALFLHSNVEANPTYQHTSSAASMAAHSTQMKSCLDTFDAVMEDKK
ncbi:hypothetical protein ONS95_005730 [Cadophora gregata]|uniref:uncharacterized protein n=1 Tax=Cadophora gregata TaxID=51156 RepID=UPI0026DA92F6|nr:uncharacterized protein ONS95_005730 [Cadophora gregata]KAK0103724.1 hypothetical protein ONS95_005730 [Cadophora gregata]KAK0107913.1 hypothetical protein ONS96_003700 [Cadophora gregata f. sp. sojae]